MINLKLRMRINNYKLEIVNIHDLIVKDKKIPHVNRILY